MEFAEKDEKMTDMKILSMGNFYEDFEIGSCIKHGLSKTIFESDNNLFSLLTMNHHPVHINQDYAKQSQYGQILVVGTLVFSLVVGITVPDISGKAIANLGYNDVLHLNPVFVGDTIYAKSVITDKCESKSKNDRGIVSIKTTGYKQDGVAVLKLERKILVKKRCDA